MHVRVISQYDDIGKYGAESKGEISENIPL
jgi:hypothetical protein